MTNEELINISKNYETKAYEVIDKLDIIKLLESEGFTVNLIGSLKTSLLIKHLDIDFHFYSDEFNIKKSITSISKIAFHKDVIKFTYKNLIDTEEECFEWHFFVKHKGEIWQIDIIHIKKNSLFDGLFEKVTDKIIKILNHKTRLAILKIKYDATFKIPGVFIYKAVINDNIENYQDFLKWYEINKNDNLLNWTP